MRYDRLSRRGAAALAVLSALALTLIAGLDCAQAGDASSPGASNVPGASSPRIYPDRRVSFELRAPGARSVLVAGGDGLGHGPFPMTRLAGGVWRVTLPPVVPGFHYYWFILDGVAVSDPASETYFGYGKEVSGLEVPDPQGDFYSVKAVPHGQVREKWYWSRVTGAWRRAFVYTPPGYDASPTRHYPLLILQHGYGEDETGWTRQGKAQFILDNLIAAGKAEPMIIVMDRGYANKPGTPALHLGPDTSAKQVGLAFHAFEDMILRDLIPTIDASYRTIPDREHRAMAGLSMGGMETLFIALRHQDTFAYIASLSGPILQDPNSSQSLASAFAAPFDVRAAYGGSFADARRFNQRVRLLWMGVGTAEPPGIRLGIVAAVKALREHGVHLVYFESAGTAHEWQTWRRGLNDLAPRLFR
ncbi:MAG TPA: alpha/beta hydrolase-fold protein [Steroidobacteraceae bacterium]|nr:alpha/beta hydrolase-fold protein [Steroidobacteraceae bacterium]